MSDNSSVYKICPQCGQSVSVAAKFCPTCGLPFSEGDAGFVAYERYQPAETFTDGAQGSSPVDYGASDGVTSEVNVYGEIPFMSPDMPDYMAEDFSEGMEDDPQLDEFREERRDNERENVPNPGVRKKRPMDAGRRNGLIGTAIAAVLLIAVITVGIVVAFRLGIVGSDEDSSDPVTLADTLYQEKKYEEAIAQLEQVIADGEATVETYELLASIYTDMEQPEDAADTYLAGFQELKDSTLKKSAIDAYLKLADTARAEGDNVAAKDYYDTVLEKLDPSNSTAIAGLNSLKQETVSTPTPSAASPSPSAAIAPPSPTTSGEGEETASPAPSGQGTAENGTTGNAATGDGTISGSEVAVVTPTAAPSPTATPTAKPSPSPSPSPSAKPSPSPSPSPSPTPKPETSFELDGHTYKLIVGDYTWWEAQEDAASRGGHVVTINSEEEFNRCAELAGNNNMVFIWLDAFVNSVDQWDTALWQTGESIDYTCWYPGEPSGGDEYYLSMFCVRGTWYYNDAVNSVSEYSGRKGYILEIE